MHLVQILALLAFAVLVAIVYGPRLLAWLPQGKAAADKVRTALAVALVDDLVVISKLRDKLASENCPAGADACTALLRVLVEHQPKNGAA